MKGGIELKKRRAGKLEVVELDNLVDKTVLWLLKRIHDNQASIAEEHRRIDDICQYLKLSRGFNKPISNLPLERIRELVLAALRQLDVKAKQLAKGTKGDRMDKDIAASEYRQQLKANLIARLIIAKANDSIENWHIANSTAGKIIVGAIALTVVAKGAALIVRHRRRKEDPNKAYSRGTAEEEEQARLKKEREVAAK